MPAASLRSPLNLADALVELAKGPITPFESNVPAMGPPRIVGVEEGW